MDLCDRRRDHLSANFSGDLVLFGSYDESLYCLTKDGKEKWKFKTNGPVNGSPAVADGKTFVAGCDSSIHVIDIDKGTELNAVELTGQAAATAAVVGEQLYVGNMANDLQAVDLEKAARSLWTFTPPKQATAVLRLRRGDGSIRCRRQPQQARVRPGSQKGQGQMDVSQRRAASIRRR